MPCRHFRTFLSGGFCMEFSFRRQFFFFFLFPCEVANSRAHATERKMMLFLQQIKVQAPNVWYYTRWKHIDSTRLDSGWLNSTIIQHLEFTTLSKCVSVCVHCVCACVFVYTSSDGINRRDYYTMESSIFTDTLTLTLILILILALALALAYQIQTKYYFMGFYSAQAAFKDLIAHSRCFKLVNTQVDFSPSAPRKKTNPFAPFLLTLPPEKLVYHTKTQTKKRKIEERKKSG